MKKMIFILPCLFSFAVGILFAQTPSPSTLQQDVKKTTKDVRTYTTEKREDYEKRVRSELEDLKLKIKEEEKKLAYETATVDKKASRMTHKKIYQLHKLERSLEAKLHRVRKIGEKDWEGLKADIDRDLVKLKKGYDDLLESMKLK